MATWIMAAIGEIRPRHRPIDNVCIESKRTFSMNVVTDRSSP